MKDFSPSLCHPHDADTLFLDLDGTLTDPSQGITRGVMYALKRFGIDEHDPKKLFPFIGPPLYDSFMRFYGFSLPSAKKAIAYFQEYYMDQGIFENIPYPGMRELLYAWHAEGKKLILATSKPEVCAVRILERFGMADAFTLIAGGDEEETRVEKAVIIDYAIKRLSSGKPEKCLMIGDRKYDVIGASAHGMPTLGVLYGFGSKEELLNAGAAWLAENINALGSIVSRTAQNICRNG